MITKDNADTFVYWLLNQGALYCPHCLKWSVMLIERSDRVKLSVGPLGDRVETRAYLCIYCYQTTTVDRTETTDHLGEPVVQFFLRDESEASDGA